MKKESKNLYAFLYDADGSDQEIELKDIDAKKIGAQQLLWLDVIERDEPLLKEIAAKLGIKDMPIESLMKTDERPKIDVFNDFYRIFVTSVAAAGNSKKLQKIAVDFIVSKNTIVTIHKGKVDNFVEFRKREKGETQIGGLNEESFLISLLDLHLLSYFRALESIEDSVDKFDKRILEKNLETAEFLEEISGLRANVSNLRRWLLPHRDVFYALARPDFFPKEKAKSVENFRFLNDHFDNLIEAVETSRDTVLSLFDLYATRSAQRLNKVMHRLTFITLVVGSMGVIAGVLGMNFKVEFFDTPGAFWIVLAGMGLIAIGAIVTARLMRWL